MGRPLMPWQRMVADVATEVLPDGSWAYGVVVLAVQRQAGKTTVCGPIEQHRCAIRPDGQVWVTAQSGADARDIWSDVAKLVRRSPFGPPATKIREANGSESITWPNGATYRPFTPAEDSLHGKPTELVRVDEAWAFDDLAGTGLEAAIMPTFTTTGGQLWIVSAGGTARSAWLLRHVLAGRLGVELGRTEGVAYFEWGITEAEAVEVAAGLSTEATEAEFTHALDLILAAHPAAGHTVRRPAVVTAARSMKPGEFLRAYGNHWTRAGESAIPLPLWAAGARDPGDLTAWPKPAPGTVAFGLAAAHDHRDAAIAAAWRDDPAGPLRVDLIAHRPGTAWAVDELVRLRDVHRPVAVGHDAAGPSRDLADELARRGVPLVATGVSDYAAACAALLRHIAAGRLEHPGVLELDAAVAAAGWRNIGDGLRAWARRGIGASIAALEAVTEAAWAFDHRPAPAAAPVVVAARPRPAAVASRTRRRGAA